MSGTKSFNLLEMIQVALEQLQECLQSVTKMSLFYQMCQCVFVIIAQMSLMNIPNAVSMKQKSKRFVQKKVLCVLQRWPKWPNYGTRWYKKISQSWSIEILSRTCLRLHWMPTMRQSAWVVLHHLIISKQRAVLFVKYL